MTAELARGILPALCTAFDDEGEGLDTDRSRRLARSLLAEGVNGFFVCGGTGEGRAMSVPERKSMAEAVAEEVAGAVPIILQVGATSTDNAVELARHAAHVRGIDAIASVAPVDRPNDLAAAVEHYAAVGGATDLPFYVYWLAHEAEGAITADRFLEAMKEVPNFAGLKFTDHNLFLFGQLIDRSGGTINAISGPDGMCLSAMVLGADAAIGTHYNVMPRLFLQIRQAFEAGDLHTAMDCQRRANRAIRIFHEFGGGLGGIKAVLGWRGTPVGPPRIGKPLDVNGQTRLRQELDGLGYEVA